MPSLGIHLLVADATFSRLPNSTVNDVKSLAPIAKYFPEMASLGAIGPDLLYYLGDGPKISAVVADVFHYLNQISSVLKDIGNLAQQGGMPNVANRINQLSETVRLAVGTAQSGLLAAVVQLNEVITGSHLFKPSAAQLEKPETDWNWGDLLHDRISGTFANKLMDTARSAANYPLLAYSTGYMTHLATDFVGHGYVNTVVGGPARGWIMRHTVSEKFMDASVFQRRNQDINTSKLHGRFSSLADTSQLANLCDVLAGLIAGFAQDSSLGYQLPGACSSKELKTAFDSMCSLFRLVTEDAYVPPPQPPQIAIPPLPGQYGSLTHAVTGIPGPGRPSTITDWLKFLLALLLLVPAVLVDMARFVTDAALGVITYPLAAAVYVFQCYVYNIYRQVRWFLVISGVLFPCVDELDNPLALQFTSSRGNGDENYPHVPPVVDTWTERLGAVTFSANNFAYLNYPKTKRELPGARPSPYPSGTTPELFMHDLDRDDQFVATWLVKNTPVEIRTLVSTIPPLHAPYKGGFGNATDLSILLLERPDIAAKLNLDSDRGYAYRQWRCDGGITAGSLVNERFI